MIKRVIALSSAICMAAAALSGCSSAENSNGGEYECGDFRFTISDRYHEDVSTSNKTFYEFSKGGSKIKIESTGIYFDDLKTYLELDADTAVFRDSSDDEVNIVSTDIVTDTDCKYSAGAVHFELDNGMGSSSYYIENETNALSINAEYKLSKKKSICRDIEALVASAEYISDFRLPTEDIRIDNEYISAVVPKEWFISEYNGDSEKILCRISLYKARAKTLDESKTNFYLKAETKNESSPKERADKLSESRKNSDYGDTSCFKYELFGVETECVETVGDDLTARICYFEHNGYSWTASLGYSTDDGLADIEDMLGRIELK